MIIMEFLSVVTPPSIYHSTNVDGETRTTVLSVFLVWFQPPKNIYLFVELSFLLHIGTQPSKTGEKLVYYNLYHKEVSLYLDVHTQLFNKTFINFLSLSSQ